MAGLSNPKQLENITDVNEFMRYCSQAVEDIQSLLTGQVEFGSNIKAQIVSQYFAQADTDVNINHNLNKTGLNYLVVQKPSSLDVYHGSSKDTTKNVYLRSTVGGVTVSILLF